MFVPGGIWHFLVLKGKVLYNRGNSGRNLYCRNTWPMMVLNKCWLNLLVHKFCYINCSKNGPSYRGFSFVDEFVVWIAWLIRRLRGYLLKADGLVGCLVIRSVCWLIDGLVTHLVGCLLRTLACQMVDRLVGWLVDWLDGWSIGVWWCKALSVSCQKVSSMIGTSRVIHPSTHLQARIYLVLWKSGG